MATAEKVEGSDKDDDSSPLTPLTRKETTSWSVWSLVGPGLFTCLADTDAGCLIVAAQSGASWGYSLLLLQIVLIPILYFAQELTVRLGVYTKKGHAACIKERYGSACAWATSLLLFGECVLTIISEMSGIAAVGELWELSRTLSTSISAAVVVVTVMLCNYRQIEVIGISLGLFELTFVVAMFWYHPSPSDVFSGMFVLHFDNSNYQTLWAANLGAVLMPFMIYFQQSAVVARQLTPRDLAQERTSTLFGSFLTQLVMIATLITYAASRSKSLENVKDMNLALEPVLGPVASKVTISLALVGGSLCAAFVASLAASWAICETAELEDNFSVDRLPSEAPRFYGVFIMIVIVGVIVLQRGVNIVSLNVYIEFINGLLMPLSVGFLFALACSETLPEEVRLQGPYKILLGVLFTICSVTSLGAGVAGMTDIM